MKSSNTEFSKAIYQSLKFMVQIWYDKTTQFICIIGWKVLSEQKTV